MALTYRDILDASYLFCNETEDTDDYEERAVYLLPTILYEMFPQVVAWCKANDVEDIPELSDIDLPITPSDDFPYDATFAAPAIYALCGHLLASEDSELSKDYLARSEALLAAIMKLMPAKVSKMSRFL